MKRLKRLSISPELFFGLLTDGYHPLHEYRIDRDAVPSDAKLVNVRHGWPNMIEILIESEAFPEIEEGSEVPPLTPIVTTFYRRILYACGHEVENKDVPQDQDWQSEVPCPGCRQKTGG